MKPPHGFHDLGRSARRRNEVESFLDLAHTVLPYGDRRLLVIVLVAQLMGEIVPQKILDAVFEHVADYKDYEKRPCDVAILDLGVPRYGCRSIIAAPAAML